jgi:hypothetical protein
VRQSQHFRFLLIAPTVQEKQKTHNFCWSIPGKKCGRNVARTRPPNSRGIVPPLLSADQGGHFTSGGRGGGGHRLVLRVRIHREGVQEPHGSQAASTTSLSTPLSWCHIFDYETFLLGPQKQPSYPLLHLSHIFWRIFPPQFMYYIWNRTMRHWEDTLSLTEASKTLDGLRTSQLWGGGGGVKRR